MSVDDPNYSKDPIIDGFEHLGHWVHIGVHDTIGLAVTTIHRGLIVTDDLKEQFPTLAEEVGTVASDVLKCKTLAAAIALAVAGGGINLAADAGVLAALVTDGPAIVALFNDSAKLAKTAGVDISTDFKAATGQTA
jgi:hypothetical protein